VVASYTAEQAELQAKFQFFLLFFIIITQNAAAGALARVKTVRLAG
jgi:hypothetical protein